MSDLISRKDAIEAIEFGITYAKAINKETGDVIELFERENESLRKAIKRIEDLPSAQPEQRWIPVTEKLPESYKDVLVYYEYYKYCDYGSVCFQTYGIGYCSLDGTWHGDVSGTKAKCLAWMPLPDAYEEDD